MTDANPLVVTAAVIEENGRFLVTRRLRGTHLAGYWEFPGGKVDANETLEQALEREIREELNVRVTDLRQIFQTTHAYPDRRIELHFFRGRLTGRPEPRLGQELKWIAREELPTLEFPAADTELIAGLLHARW